MARANIVFRDAELDRILGDEILLPVDQAAVYLFVSASTLNHWRSNGLGPRFVKLCGSTRGAIRYRVADLRAFVNAHTFTSVAEAELAAAMSRVSETWDDWPRLHPFIAKGPSLLLDSALADVNTLIGLFFDPFAKVRWLRPATALTRPWCRPERRLELLRLYSNTDTGRTKVEGIHEAYLASLSKISEQQWGCHPDMSLAVLSETASGAPYPIAFSA